MNIVSFLNQAREGVTKTCWNLYAENVGRSLIHLGALGCLFSALAQIGMISKRKDLDPKEKEFLLAQEKADGIFNVISYYTVCEAIKQTGDMIIERGHFVTKKSFDMIMKMKQSSNSISDFVKAMNEVFVGRNFLRNANYYKRMSNFYDGSIAILDKLILAKNSDPVVADKMNKMMIKIFENNPALRKTFTPILEKNKLRTYRSQLRGAKADFDMFKNGVGVFSAVLASLLACNIITPIARNKIANHYQKKKLLHKMSNDSENRNMWQDYAFTQKTMPKTYDVFRL